MRMIPLVSGSSGNATLVEAGNTRLLIDAGVTGKAMEALLQSVDLSPAALGGILITHEHSDHIKGVGVLSRKYDLPVYANARTWEELETLIGAVAPHNQRLLTPDREAVIGDIALRPFPISHDAVCPMGYRLSHKGQSAAVMTDTGYAPQSQLDAVSGVDVLLLEANHDVDMLLSGSYPYPLKQRILSRKGHLSNDSAGQALLQLHQMGVRNCVLGHLSNENNDPKLALRTVKAILDEGGVLDDMRLIVAERYRVTGVFAWGE